MTVAFAPDGKTVAAGGADNRIRIWSVSEDAAEGSNNLLLTHFAHEGAVLNLAFSADGQALISSAADKTVKVFKAADLAELQLLETQPDWTPALAFLGGNKVAVGRIDGSLGFYDAATGKPEKAPAAESASMKKPAPPASTKPEITRLEPAGVQSGATTKVKVTGKNLAGGKAVKFSRAGLSAAFTSISEDGASAELNITAEKDLPRSSVELSVETAAGESAKKTLLVDYLPQLVASKSAKPILLDRLPINVWGTLAETGEQDNYRFAAKAGEAVVFDLTAKRLESKALTPRLEVFDAEGKLLAANNALDSGSDPFIGFVAPKDGEYTVRVLEITLEGSPDHVYRLTAGRLPYVTGLVAAFRAGKSGKQRASRRL